MENIVYTPHTVKHSVSVFGPGPYLNNVKVPWLLFHDGMYELSTSVKSVALILGVNDRTLRRYLYGKSQRDYYPRKIIKEFGGPYKDDGDIIVLSDVYFHNGEEIVGVDYQLPLESIYNIITSYTRGYYTKKIKPHQADLGLRCLHLAENWLPGLRKQILNKAGYSSRISRNFKAYFDEQLFGVEYAMLKEVLKEVYPDRKFFKYEAMANTIFRYLYEDCIGKSAFRDIKAKKNKFEKCHFYVSSQPVRMEMKAWLGTFVTVMQMLYNRQEFDLVRHGSITAHVRYETNIIMDNLLRSRNETR